MDRLRKKGVLQRQIRGKAYAYWSRLSREEFHRQIAAQILDSLLPEVTEPLLAAYIEQTALAGPRQLDRLEELIRSRRAALQHRRSKPS
jgi:predicted transcriptional regulator